VTIGLQNLNGSILKINATIESVLCPPWLHFEPIKLLNFDLIADPELFKLNFIAKHATFVPKKVTTYILAFSLEMSSP
jgi:hypothetical protein